jgi:NHL repeat
VIKDNLIYVADRENNRIQRFDLDGRYLGEWYHLGKPCSLQIIGDELWVGTGAPDQAVLRGGQRGAGWLLKVDVSTGKIVGSIESNGAHHFIEATPAGELMGESTPDGFTWFRK